MEYNEVVAKLKKTEPILENADALTDKVMQRVEQTVVGAGRIRAMRISGALSGIAASALICLFAYETLKYPVSPVANYSENRQSYTSYTSYMSYMSYMSYIDIQEKEKIIETMVKKKVAQRARNEQLKSAFIARNKIAKQY